MNDNVKSIINRLKRKVEKKKEWTLQMINLKWKRKLLDLNEGLT